MKKRQFKSLALVGITSGLCVLSSVEGQPQETDYDPNSENEGYYIMTEDELIMQLNYKGRELYEKLDSDGKKLAIKAASRRCNGANECKGLNACKTDDNECAGKGQCKGTTKCAFGDKNLAVKLVYKKMTDKREAAGN